MFGYYACVGVEANFVLLFGYVVVGIWSNGRVVIGVWSYMELYGVTWSYMIMYHRCSHTWQLLPSVHVWLLGQTNMLTLSLGQNTIKSGTFPTSPITIILSPCCKNAMFFFVVVVLTRFRDTPIFTPTNHTHYNGIRMPSSRTCDTVVIVPSIFMSLNTIVVT